MEQKPQPYREIDTLLENGFVLPMTEEGPVLENASVAIKGGRIVEVGPAAELAKRYRAAQTISAVGQAILPGFVNTHFHYMQNFLKGSRDDLDLLEWIDQVSFPRIQAVVEEYRKGNHLLHYHAARHAGLDLLRSGVTTSVNMEWAMAPPVVQGYDEVGIRVVNTLTLTDVDSWTPPAAILNFEEYFELAGSLIEACEKSVGGKIRFAYGLACPNSCTEKMLRRAREEATKNGQLLHIHLAETRYEYDRFMKEKGATPTAWLESLGFWGPDSWAAHSIWLDEADIDILAKHGVGVAHNPKCNMKIADGAAPVAAMLKRGLAVGLGIDSCAVSDNTDFFEAMRAALFLQRVHNMDARAILAKNVLWMATLGGAKALHMEREIGSLEVGKQADLLMVDLTRPGLRPLNNLLNNLVFAANSADISMVMVGGEILRWGGKALCLDERETMLQAEEYAEHIFRKAGLSLAPYFTYPAQSHNRC